MRPCSHTSRTAFSISPPGFLQALARSRILSELFGHENGAFEGATLNEGLPGGVFLYVELVDSQI